MREVFPNDKVQNPTFYHFFFYFVIIFSSLFSVVFKLYVRLEKNNCLENWYVRLWVFVWLKGKSPPACAPLPQDGPRYPWHSLISARPFQSISICCLVERQAAQMSRIRYISPHTGQITTRETKESGGKKNVNPLICITVYACGWEQQYIWNS